MVDEVLGVLDIPGLLGDSVAHGEDERIEKLVEERNQARKNKDFARGDEIRDMLLEEGIILKDSPEGTKWHRKL
jgi:cysteinyl-tRNA synthetase